MNRYVTAKRKKREKNNKNSMIEKRSLLFHYFRHHYDCFFTALQQLRQQFMSYLMTLLVMGIALALPALLSILLGNFNDLMSSFKDQSQLSAFIDLKASEWQTKKLATDLQQLQEVAKTQIIDREQALAEFELVSGFGDLLNELPSNPLPDVILITPRSSSSPESVQLLKSKLEALPLIESVQYDMDWLKKLQAIIQFGQRIALLIAALLGIGVIFIVSNTIRLLIENQKTEIEVTKLIGASNAFVQRPYLYVAFWLGFIGSCFALLIIVTALLLLQASVATLADLYQTPLSLHGISLQESLWVIAVGIMLSVAGSWWVVRQTLKRIEPS